jgi:hypothetical protein
MRAIAKLLAIGLFSAGLSGCATAIPSVDVTRFHNSAPAPSGTISVTAAQSEQEPSMEYRIYAAAVGQELQRIGFAEVLAPKTPQFVARVSYERVFRGAIVQKNSPVSVSVGGSAGSYGSGVGLGLGIDLSGPPKRTVITTLSIQIRKATDAADAPAIWEGRASTEAREGSPAAQPGLASAKLASALFGGYPGQSGQTITVK